MTSSPTKYDGYTAYLSSINSSNTFPSNSAAELSATEQADQSQNDSSTPTAAAAITPQKSSLPSTARSPPFTPSTPPPPPPVPEGGLPPLCQSNGSFADAVRPLGGSPTLHEHKNVVRDCDGTSEVDAEHNMKVEKSTSPEHKDHQKHCTPQKSPEQQEEEDQQSQSSDESNPPEWEDFMAHYWKLPTPPTPEFQIHAHAQDILLIEDTDLKPCPMEPTLDEEPYLSPIRTGCIDIDMEMRSMDELDSHQAIISPMKELSNAGLESSRIMAKLHVGKIRAEAVSIATPMKRAIKDDTFRTRTESFDLQSPNSFDEKKSVTSNSNTATSDKNPSPTEEEWPHKISPLPSNKLIHSFGPIQTRISLRSLVMKKWSPSYWMHYGPHTLMLFRSKEQMDDWRYNPYHGKKAREYLIKQKIDFYGEMSGGEKEGKGGVLGHRILPVKRKSYGKNETEMYQFKLERWTNLGVSVLAAFASEEEAEVQALHETIAKILKSCPYGGLRDISHMLK